MKNVNCPSCHAGVFLRRDPYRPDLMECNNCGFQAYHSDLPEENEPTGTLTVEQAIDYAQRMVSDYRLPPTHRPNSKYFQTERQRKVDQYGEDHEAVKSFDDSASNFKEPIYNSIQGWYITDQCNHIRLSTIESFSTSKAYPHGSLEWTIHINTTQNTYVDHFSKESEAKEAAKYLLMSIY